MIVEYFDWLGYSILCALGIKLFGLMVLPEQSVCMLVSKVGGHLRLATMSMGLLMYIAQAHKILTGTKSGRNRDENGNNSMHITVEFLTRNIHKLLNYVCKEKCVRLSMEYGDQWLEYRTTRPIPRFNIYLYIHTHWTENGSPPLMRAEWLKHVSIGKWAAMPTCSFTHDLHQTK